MADWAILNFWSLTNFSKTIGRTDTFWSLNSEKKEEEVEEEKKKKEAGSYSCIGKLQVNSSIGNQNFQSPSSNFPQLTSASIAYSKRTYHSHQLI